MKKIQWGVLSTATIAVEQVIPAIGQSEYGEVFAIASRTLGKAEKTAQEFGIPNFYGSYDALLADHQVQAVYIPLPNHLHVQWAIKALRAGKHVLVEKPVALDIAEAQELLDEANKHPHLKIMEAFMYKFHPQWIHVQKMVKEGVIGSLKMIQSSFSFFDDDPESIINNKKYGGGSLMDVGCYPISISRYLYDAEPKRIMATLDDHPDFGVDIRASGVLEFDQGQTVFFSSIQMMDHQEVKLFGMEGIIEFELPFNPPYDQSVKITVVKENSSEDIVFEACNQYSLQADVFSKSILENKKLPVTLEDAVSNMRVIQGVKESGRLGKVIDM